MKISSFTLLLVFCAFFCGCSDDDDTNPSSGGSNNTPEGENLPEKSDFFIAASLNGDSVNLKVDGGTYIYIDSRFSGGTVCSSDYGGRVLNNNSNGYVNATISLKFEHEPMDGVCDDSGLFYDFFDESTYDFYNLTIENESGVSISMVDSDGQLYVTNSSAQNNVSFEITEVEELPNNFDPIFVGEGKYVAVTGTFNCELVNSADETDTITAEDGTFFLCFARAD